jgi:hypothetical protein
LALARTHDVEGTAMMYRMLSTRHQARKIISLTNTVGVSMAIAASADRTTVQVGQPPRRTATAAAAITADAANARNYKRIASPR